MVAVARTARSKKQLQVVHPQVLDGLAVTGPRYGQNGWQHDMSPAMTKPQKGPTVGFTPGEREYVRRGLDMFFSTYPSVAEGFHLKTWRSGPQAGQPKIPPTAKGLLERGLMRLDTSGRLPRLFFTDAGMAELRAMMSDRRLADPVKFAHVRQELGIDPPVAPTDTGT
jgi:hypothetical protein